MRAGVYFQRAKTQISGFLIIIFSPFTRPSIGGGGKKTRTLSLKTGCTLFRSNHLANKDLCGKNTSLL